jgi:predicted ferric reductase
MNKMEKKLTYSTCYCSPEAMINSIRRGMHRWTSPLTNNKSGIIKQESFLKIFYRLIGCTMNLKHSL